MKNCVQKKQEMKGKMCSMGTAPFDTFKKLSNRTVLVVHSKCNILLFRQ